MRILHTADWHLGRLFHQLHLTEDQAHVLEQFVALVRDTRPDVVLIAGDVYDRAVPPPEAVALLDDVLSRLTLDCHTPVVLIAGNHDSPQRLHFGSRLLAERGLHVVGTGGATSIAFADADGPVYLYALPYAEPPVVRERLGGDIHDHDAAMRAQVDALRAQHPADARAVLLAHAFVTGGDMSPDSERPLSVGGTGEVGTDAFANFHYVALGHLHRPQSLERGRVRYAGSLMKYAFAEADHRKSVSLVEMDATGRCRLEEFSLTPRREVRRISGRLNDLLAAPQGNPDDYLEVTLLDERAILDAMGKLREVYPNVLHIERPAYFAASGGVERRGDHRGRDAVDLFADFFVQVTGNTLNEEWRAAFAEIAERSRREEREVVSV